jgi:hypothetical protein
VKPYPQPVFHGRFQLLRWVGAWTNEGADHGRGCRFSTREDAEAYARYEQERNYEGEAQFAVIELPLPPPPFPGWVTAVDPDTGRVYRAEAQRIPTSDEWIFLATGRTVRVNAEGVTWVRGEHADDSEEVKMLKAARIVRVS